MRPQRAEKQEYFMRQFMRSQHRHTPAETDRRKRSKIRKSPVEIQPVIQSEGLTDKVFV